MGDYLGPGRVAVIRGDARSLPLPDASVDAIVCDPPYELAFMAREWDASGVAYDPATWREAARVLKPGGHLAAFGAPRTYHRMACAIEDADAGLEIRDSLHWVYGSGFPKGQDIAKVIDKRRDDRAAALRVTAWLAAARDAAGWTNQDVDAAFGTSGMARHWTTSGMTACVPAPAHWDRLRELLGFDDAEIRPLVAELNARKGTLGEGWAQREPIGTGHRVRRVSDVQIAGLSAGAFPITAPATDLARQWQGWNTALKPGHEPIVLARKSTGWNSTVANVITHGTGALNIDACRIAVTDTAYARNASGDRGHDANRARTSEFALTAGHAHAAGRWPTNVVFVHAAECTDTACAPGCPVADLDQQSGATVSSGRPMRHRVSIGGGATYGGGAAVTTAGYDDRGGGSRFFPVFRYEPKAGAAERPRLADGTAWPTVKPVALMRWLVRLITPPGGIVCDPFAGTGATGEAARAEGFRAVLIDADPDAVALTRRRLTAPPGVRNRVPPVAPAAATPVPVEAAQLDLFDLDPEPAGTPARSIVDVPLPDFGGAADG